MITQSKIDHYSNNFFFIIYLRKILSSFIERPNSSIGISGQASQNSDNQQHRATLKKVKVLCQQKRESNGLSSPQPLLASSNSQKNINMVKALQQINQMMTQSSIQSISLSSSNNFLNQQSLKSTQSTKNLLAPANQFVITSQTPTNPLTSSQNQQLLGSQQSLQSIIAKSPKLNVLSSQSSQTPLLNIPLSLKSSSNNPTQLKLKQLQQKASILQKSESHQSLLQFSAAQYQQSNCIGQLKTLQKHKGIHHQQSSSKDKKNQNHCQNGSLSPKTDNKHSNKSIQKQLQSHKNHNRQQSVINFNILSSSQVQNLANFHQIQHQHSQQSLSPINKPSESNAQSQAKYHTQSRQSNDRIKSMDNNSLENMQRNLKSSQLNSDLQDFNKQGNIAQIIRVSPKKQFIVQSCHTQQTSPQDQFKNQQTKIYLKNPSKERQNLILEQEDYLLPLNEQQDGSVIGGSSATGEDQDIIQQYSLKKDYQTLVHHNHKMLRGGLISDTQSVGKQKQKESEESINKGFLTDRYQSTSNINELKSGNNLEMQSQQYTRQKKTKGISYTRNAQELKKLLLETGVIGNLGLTSSLATAAAGMISSTQDTLFVQHNDITSMNKTAKNPNKSQTSKVKNSEVFSFSTKGKTSKNVIFKDKKGKENQQVASTCLLENQMLMKKSEHHRVMSQLESSVQNLKPQSSALNKDLANLPQSTQNKLREFILQEDVDDMTPNKAYQNYIDDQVIYNQKTPLAQKAYQKQGYAPLPSKRSPSSQVAFKEDSPTNSNFPFIETEQFIQKNENKRALAYSGSVIDIHNKQLQNNQKNQKSMARCWTAHGDISTERDRQQQYVLQERKDLSNLQQFSEGYYDDSRVDSVGGAPPTLLIAQNNQQILSHMKNLQNHHAASQIVMNQKRQSCLSSQSKNTCFTYDQNYQYQNQGMNNNQPSHSPMNRFPYSSMINPDDNNYPNNKLSTHSNLVSQPSSNSLSSPQLIQNTELTNKEMEILKFKMIAFVKTYENQFQKMKMQMNELQQENQQLKKKLNVMSSRKMSATTISGQTVNNQNGSQSYSSAGFNKVGSNANLPNNHPNTCLASAHTSQIM